MGQCKSEHPGFKKAKEKTWDRVSLRKETLKNRKEDFRSEVLRNRKTLEARF
jgi:predicted aminopeptidase